MAYYLVRAKPKQERLDELRDWLDSGEIEEMRPFGKTLQHSLVNARRESEGVAVWEEEDYCRPPLDAERKAVLDAYFTELSVEHVTQGEGWQAIDELPSLWKE